jgi:hypothetical protein
MNTERKWTSETEAKIERIFGGEYPMDAIEALADTIVENHLAGIAAMDDRASVEEIIDPDDVWGELDAYREPPRKIMLPAIIDCAIILAGDPVFVAYGPGGRGGGGAVRRRDRLRATI